MKVFSIQSQKQNDNVDLAQRPHIFYERFSLNNYKRYLDGLARIKTSSVVFCGCIRDIQPSRFGANIERCHLLGRKFDKYEIVLVENDSTQNFIQAVQHFQKQYNNLTLLSHKFGYPKLGDGRDIRRVSIMSKLRNQYIAYIKEHFYDYDFVIVIDMDLLDWRIDGVITTFGHDPRSWDMMGANGVQARPNETLTYYDTFALIEKNGLSYKIKEFKNLPEINSSLQPVMTCFGGIGVYKMESILAGQRYSIYKIDDKVCSEQCGIHINMAKAGFEKIFINPSMVVLR